MVTALNLFDLTGKVALVTGGSRGLGLQMAAALAEAGADLAICGRKEAPLVAAAETLTAGTGRRVLPVVADVTKPEAVEHLVSATHQAYGRIDVLVNNAGIAWAAPPEEIKLADWQKVLDLDLTGVFMVAQAVGRVMLAQGGGSIINITSVAGLRGTDLMQTTSYSTAKGAVISLTMDLAVKWGPRGVRVNAIAPGYFRTKLSEWVVTHLGDEIVRRTPLGRLGGEDDLKGAVIYLASAASAYVTGHVLTVDGGGVARF